MLHLASIILAGILFVAGYVFLFKALNEQFEMQSEINAKLPASKQVDPVFWTFRARQRFSRLQRELLPGSPRRKNLRRFVAISIVLWLSGLMIVGITFGKMIK